MVSFELGKEIKKDEKVETLLFVCLTIRGPLGPYNLD